IDAIEADWWSKMGQVATGLLSDAHNWKIVHDKRGYWRRAPRVGVAGKIANVLDYKIVYDLVKGGFDEGKKRGYTGNDLINAYKHIGDNLSFALQNPDAALNSLTEGVTSTTAVVLNNLTFDAFDVSGQGIENTINWAADALGF
ncbi:MAG: hypothetical protein WC291_10160, partial [Thermodesulfovibrionales bacterium]